MFYIVVLFATYMVELTIEVSVLLKAIFTCVFRPSSVIYDNWLENC